MTDDDRYTIDLNDLEPQPHPPVFKIHLQCPCGSFAFNEYDDLTVLCAACGMRMFREMTMGLPGGGE